jgi:dipeptidyl aminopeptidase/acylaminoacyl peptidase
MFLMFSSSHRSPLSADRRGSALIGRAIRPDGFGRALSTLLDEPFAFAHHDAPTMAFVHAHRHPRRRFPALSMRSYLSQKTPVLLLSAWLLVACSGGETTAPSTTGTLRFTVTTTGADIPPDGFSIAVDGGAAQPLPANGTLSWIGAGGAHTIAITGLAFNCDLATAPASATITLGQVTPVAVQVACATFLRNAVVYLSDAYGFAEVMVMRPDGSRIQRLTTDQAVYASPAVSPDGQSIAVASYVDGGWKGIYLLNRFGQARVKLVGHSSFDGEPAWSPDGTKIAFRSTLPGPYGDYGRIFVINRDGTGLRQLSPETTDYTYDASPSWSPDGTQIAYSHNGALYVINADGNAPTSLGINGMYPAWSPDGSKIAYYWYNAANTVTHIFVADRNGTNVHELTTAELQDQYPQWSPDGREITFHRVENATNPPILHIYKMAPDGSGVARIDAMTASDYEATWSPLHQP